MTVGTPEWKVAGPKQVNIITAGSNYTPTMSPGQRADLQGWLEDGDPESAYTFDHGGVPVTVLRRAVLAVEG